MVVHPEVGKWLIALGEQAFGMDPFGWRVAAAVVGTLMVLVMCRFVRRLTGSTLLGCVGGLLLSFDGLHFVLSRLALLDIFLAFFLLCAVHCLVADRDWLRRRLAATADLDARGTSRAAQPLGPGAGAALAARGGSPPASASGSPWAPSGARSSRWPRSGSWCGPGAPAPGGRFGVRWPVLALGGRRRRPGLRLTSSSSPSSSTSPPGPAGWCTPTSTRSTAPRPSTRRTTAASSGRPPTEPDADGLGEVVQSLRSLWHYHQDVYVFHTHFLQRRRPPLRVQARRAGC